MRDVLTDEEEAVLVTVDALTFDRVLPAPARIGLQTRPPMTTAEVMLTAGRLAKSGLLYIGEDDGRSFYSLTGEGSETVQAIIARGT